MFSCRSKALILALLAVVCASAETVRNPAKRPERGPYFKLFGMANGASWIAQAESLSLQLSMTSATSFMAWRPWRLAEGHWGYIDETRKACHRPLVSMRFGTSLKNWPP